MSSNDQPIPKLSTKHLPHGVSEVWIDNSAFCTATMSFRFTTLQNARHSYSTPGDSFVVSVPARQNYRLLSVSPADRSRPYSFTTECRIKWGDVAAKHDARLAYRLPYPDGMTCRVGQGFNGATSHYGDNAYAVDFDMPEGTPVLAARAGVVALTEQRYSHGAFDRSLADKANYVQVAHADGTLATYSHLRLGGVCVAPGDAVRIGQLLGYSGNTGFSSRAHLHFEIYKALDGYRQQSFPMLFKAVGHSTPVSPTEGASYTAF